MFVEKHWVYVLQSCILPDKHYVGLTSDVEERLKFHNKAVAFARRDQVWKFTVGCEI